MKKLLAIFTALVFTAGMAISQNIINETVQKGDKNESNVNQVGSVLSAFVTQVGDQNIGNANQVVQKDASATIEQRGNKNEAYISQTSSWNVAVIANTYQRGDLNLATQKQSATYSEADIMQIGNRNIAHQDQIGSQQAVYADVEQRGDRNLAIQNQKSGVRLYADIIQKGDDNKAYQTQNNGDFSEVMTAKADATQLGDKNFIWQDQQGVDNLVNAYQRGDLNVSYQTQTGADNSSIVTQIGDSNHSVVNQAK